MSRPMTPTASQVLARLEQIAPATIKLRLLELLERQARQGQPTRNIMYYLNTIFYEAEPRLTKAGEPGRAKVASLIQSVGKAT